MRSALVVLGSALALSSLSFVVGCEGAAEGEGEGDEGEGEGEEGEGDVAEGEGDIVAGEGEGDVGGEGEGEGDGAFTCTTGDLLSGDPNFDSEVGARAAEGSSLAGVQGEPMLWRNVVFVGDQMVTHIGQEVWTTDLSEANPTLHRVAGLEDTAGQALADGACADARFANLFGLVAASDGSLFVSDQTGNAILQITDPFNDALCAVHYWAGTSVDTAGITPDTPPNVGDTNGPGLTAQFGLPERMAIDADDNLYVWDHENLAIKKIANDADHTVSDFAAVADGAIVDAQVVIGDALYLYEHDTTGDVFIEHVDLADGAKVDVIRGHADVFNFNSSDSLQAGGMTTDGIDLFVYFKGVIFSVTVDGVVTRIAGDDSVRSTIEFDGAYDPAAEHPALELQLANRPQFATAGADSWLSIDANDDLYFSGSVLDSYLEKISCGR